MLMIQLGRWRSLGTDGNSKLYTFNIFQNIDAILQLTPQNPIIEFSKSLYFLLSLPLEVIPCDTSVIVH